MSNSGLSPAAPIGVREPFADKTHVFSTCRRDPINRVYDRMLQASTEPVVANLSVPWGTLVEGQISGLGNVHHFSP